MAKPIHQLDAFKQLEIAEDPSTRKATLRYLAYSTDFMSILEIILKNPNCPNEIINLIADENLHELHHVAEEVRATRRNR